MYPIGSTEANKSEDTMRKAFRKLRVEITADDNMPLTVITDRTLKCDGCGKVSRVTKRRQNITEASLLRIDKLFNYSRFHKNHMFWNHWIVNELFEYVD
jgi:hypothetical protein